MTTFKNHKNYFGVTTSGQAFRYIFFVEKTKKDVAAILNAPSANKKT